MAQDGPRTYDLPRLMQLMAEDLWGPTYWFNYRDFGYAEGFSDGTITIRPGRTLMTDHLVFLEMGDHKVATDQYGDTYRYVKGDPIEAFLACILADALREARYEAELLHVDHTEQDTP